MSAIVGASQKHSASVCATDSWGSTVQGIVGASQKESDRGKQHRALPGVTQEYLHPITGSRGGNREHL